MLHERIHQKTIKWRLPFDFPHCHANICNYTGAMEDNPSTKPGDLNVFMALSGSLTHPPATQSYSWTKGAQRACFCFLSVCQHLMDSNGARHRSEVIREGKKNKKNKWGPRIMKTNPHCCQGVQAVFNQHIHIQGRWWKKGMRPSVSLQSLKKNKTLNSLDKLELAEEDNRGERGDNDQAWIRTSCFVI